MTALHAPPPVVPGSRAGSRRNWAAVAFLAMVVAELGILAVLAHPARVRTVTLTPSDGAHLPAPPDEVSLSFDDLVDPAELHVSVVDVDGVPVATGAPRLVGQHIVVPVAISSGGGYRVSYHVRLLDGYEAYGRGQFSVAGGGSGLPVRDGTGDERTDAGGGARGDAGGHVHGGPAPANLFLLYLDIALIVVAGSLLLRPVLRRAREPVNRP